MSLLSLMSNEQWMQLLIDKLIVYRCIHFSAGYGDTSTWCFSQIKGALDDDVTDADIISCVEFNHDGELLATGDKGGRVVIFQVSEQSPQRFRPQYPNANGNHFLFSFLHPLLPRLRTERSCLESRQPEARRIQRLFHISVTRAGIRLLEIARDRRENQQDPMAEAKESSTFPDVDKR